MISNMEPSLRPTIALLSRTPAAFDALLRGLPDEIARCNEGSNTWNAFDVVGHLVYADREDWIPRAKRILESGESKHFDPFDRLGHVKESEGKSLGALLDEFARVRKEKLGELHALNLQSEDLARRGRHPALGPVLLAELLSAWAAHDLTHLHQVSRILAHPYRESVGPFAAYLGVMQCTGHGA